MSTKSEVIFENHCRVCLCSNLAMYSLFNENKYSLKLTECTNVEVTIDDGFPNVICEKCLDNLPMVYDFVMKCRNSDRKLKQCLTKGLLQKTVLNIEYVVNVIETKIKIEPDSVPTDLVISKCDKSSDDSNNFAVPGTGSAATSSEMKGEDCNKESNFKNVLYANLKDSKLKARRSKKNTLHKPLLQCPVCDFKASRPASMTNHSRKHTGDKPFTCDYCKRSFSLKGSLVRHIACHMDRIKTFSCSVCGQGSYDAKQAAIHMRVHTKETPYHCQVCPKKFAQRTSLILHSRTHTGEKPYACKTCGRKFSSSSLMIRHNLVHTTERPFVCSICGVALKSKHGLSQHLLVHQGNKSYKCDHCGMAFLKKEYLKLHMNTVHSEKSGKCSVCSKQCSNLENHMRLHTGETPFQCNICTKSYSKQASLTAHLNNHANTGKYPCSFKDCKEKFKSNNMVDYHIMKHHNNHTPHICDFCGRGFFRINDLSRHQAVTHNQKNQNQIQTKNEK